MDASWNHSADAIWCELDPRQWEITHNPWGVLQTVSRARLEALLTDPAFRERLAASRDQKAQRRVRSSWFEQAHPQAELGCVAYFSMEFMLSEALPIYSGGLGNVAGDQLKAAQRPGRAGGRRGPALSAGLFPPGDRSRRLAARALSATTIRASCPSRRSASRRRVAAPRARDAERSEVWLRAWQVQVGRTHALPARQQRSRELPAYRGITSELYGGGPETAPASRRALLGIGGWRLLRALGLRPDVCHLNEGHAAFAVLERARDFMAANGKVRSTSRSPPRARATCSPRTRRWRRGSIVSTPRLIERYLGGYARTQLGICASRAAGARPRRDPGDAAEPFNMAYLAHRAAAAGQRRQPPARRGEPSPLLAALPAVAERRGADRLTSPTASTSRPGTRGRRRAVDAQPAARSAGSARQERWSVQIRACLGRRAVGAAQRRPTAPAGACSRARLARQLAAAGARASEIDAAGTRLRRPTR